ncbi:metallophosphoesterase [Pseudoalteromonas sp. meg-B1]|uniref:metallophosphoesterase n=1 Tax=Pseudoalteromonas sp. meg-B1 TaxID=2203192 RepID=UPI000D6F63A0|nr:metallophosphoesterase [Pseudoalteromonas sp. meg-B1]PWS55398.1 3',5'-cyclic-nucleotide phosphodiesterase [Pseudoalteromonas sp. meg-B1]
MAWFDDIYYFEQTTLRIAHLTDCHLFSDKDAKYFGVNTAEHFVKALADIAKQQPDALIFGGDLTQDHSFNSYLLFAELIHNSDVDCPVFWVPGNHDEIEQLNLISGGQIQHAKHIVAQGIELILINSKGDTPAGWVSATHLDEIMACLVDSNNRHIAFCHHNPLPINGYLDKHMLENGPQLLNLLVNNGRVDALFHGHVHNDYQQQFRGLNVYATPASCVQFSKHSATWQQENKGAAYRMLYLNAEQQQVHIHSDVVWLNE